MARALAIAKRLVVAAGLGEVLALEGEGEVVEQFAELGGGLVAELVVHDEVGEVHRRGGFVGRGVAVQQPGGSVALDAGIGVGVEAGGGACGFGVVDDLDGARRRCVGVVAQGDGLADEPGVDLVEPCVEAHRSVFHHAAFGLEEEEVVEVGAGVGRAPVVVCEGPRVEGGGTPVESAVG